MFDRRQNRFVTYNAFLFDAAFTDGFGLEIQVNPEFQTFDAVRQAAKKYSWLIGQLPRALRQSDFQTVWIHKGVELFGQSLNDDDFPLVLGILPSVRRWCTNPYCP